MLMVAGSRLDYFLTRGSVLQGGIRDNKTKEETRTDSRGNTGNEQFAATQAFGAVNFIAIRMPRGT